MADCAACGTRLEEGLTVCPECGGNLQRPGQLLQIGGWVLLCASSVPIAVGVITAEQKEYVPLGFGLAMLAAGVIMILLGRAKVAGSPELTRPSTSSMPPPSAPAKA